MSSARVASSAFRTDLSPSSNGQPASTMAASSSNRESSTGQPGSTRPLPNIQDLVARAERRIEESRQSADVAKMLKTAELSLNQSRFFIDVNRMDSAYMEYLVGAQIVLNVIPKSHDRSAYVDHTAKSKKHKELIKAVNADQDTFSRIRDLIKADNERNNVRPLPGTQQKVFAVRSATDVDNASEQLGHVASQATQRNSMASAPAHTRPVPQGPRPQGEHSRSQSVQTTPAASNGVNGDSALADRFAKLRVSSRQADLRPHSVALNRAERPDKPSLHLGTDPGILIDPPSSRPQSQGASTAEKFPKAPSPTYTPIRSMQSPTAIAPPRSTRAAIQLHDQPPSPASSVSTRSGPPAVPPRPLVSKHASKRSEDANTLDSSARQQRKSIHKPMETEIDNQKLFYFISTYSVLLIDVRNREDYDQGHIFASTVICVEPTALRAGMSADELYEALVLSPQEEQEFFDHRDLFDLVVYYDQTSTSSDKARARNPAIVYLQEALYDYNQEKPLKFPPILLDGGLDSWVELMGPQSLKTSRTAHKPRVTKPRSESRAYASSKIDASKRRHREYNPLAPDEEQKWRERARSESIVLDQQPPRETQSEETSYDIDDFSRRYPDVSILGSDLEQPPQEPSNVPAYPAPPRPTQRPPPPPTPQQAPPLPPVPSRPPPAIARPSYSGVSERSASQQVVPQRPQALAPYIPPRLKRVPRVGLHNFGATCYMNSTIQCLSATIDMTALFLDGAFKRDLQTENWRGSKGLMPELYCILLRNLWESSDVDTIRPTNFRKFCARLNQEWGTDRQQDAKEFLDFLIDVLHEDLNVNWQRHPLRPLTDDEEARRERMDPIVASKVEWDRYVHRDKSRLTDLFAGQHISKLQCTTCRHTSTTYETFYSISVEIPQLQRPVTIYDCLKSYCQAERLSGDEEWKCPRCKCEREAIKRITITRVPAFLVIHFKRFSASHSERARKIHTAVDFPLGGLELDSFVLPKPNERQQEEIANSYAGRDPQPSCMTPPYRYDAYAVTRHLGQTMASGHYIGLVKDRARGVWREFNDERVTDFKPEELSPSKRLQNEQAYIVFYQRVQKA